MLYKSALMSQASGSLGGITASHNKGGQYFRARTIPTDPGSSYQVAVRNNMVVLSTRWVEVLTEAQRLAWDVYAGAVETTNALGSAVNITGLNMYIRGNAPRIQAGLPIVDNGPTVFSMASFTDPTFALDEPNDEVDVTFDDTDAWANEDDAGMIVAASRATPSLLQRLPRPLFSRSVSRPGNGSSLRSR